MYAAWAEEKGLSPLALSDYKKKTLTDGFFGTVDAKVGGRNRSDTIHVYIPKKKEKYQVNYVAKNETADDIYQYDYLKIRDKYSVYFGGNQSLVEVKTDSKSKRKLLSCRILTHTVLFRLRCMILKKSILWTFAITAKVSKIYGKGRLYGCSVFV